MLTLINYKIWRTNDNKGDDEREEDVVDDEDVAQADGDYQVEAEVEGVDEGPFSLPVDEHRRAHRAVQTDAANICASTPIHIKCLKNL